MQRADRGTATAITTAATVPAQTPRQVARKLRAIAQRLGKEPVIARAGNLDRAKPREMRCQELGVEQAIAAAAQPRDEMGERDLARIANSAEHALAEKGGAERDAVEPADQLVPLPAFDAVRGAALEKSGVEPHDLVVDPGPRAGFARLGAAADD